MNAYQNVVYLNQDSVYEDIKTFLDTRKSNNTRKSYTKTYMDFFKYMRNKDIEQLVAGDLKFKFKDVLNYQSYLQTQYANKTVNQKINSLRSLFKYLKKNEYHIINPEAFEVENLSENESKTIGFFKSYDEAMQMVREAKTLPRGEMKSVLLDLATHTSVRLSGLLRVKLSDFTPIDDEKYLMTTIDKGDKKVKKAITKELYNRVLNVAKDKSEDEKIFNISGRQIADDIKRLCEKMDMGKDRNISFHSFRKVAAMYEITENGDIVAAARALNHGSIMTTYNYYIEHNRDYDSEASITMGQKEDISNVKKLSYDELQMMIEMMTKKSQKEANKIAGNIINMRDEASN